MKNFALSINLITPGQKLNFLFWLKKKQWFRSEIYFFVYDITKKETFGNLKQWTKEINKRSQENSIKVLLGNKSDLISKY